MSTLPCQPGGSNLQAFLTYQRAACQPLKVGSTSCGNILEYSAMGARDLQFASVSALAARSTCKPRSGVDGKFLLKTKFPLKMTRAQSALNLQALLPAKYISPAGVLLRPMRSRDLSMGSASASKTGLPRQVVRLAHGDYELDVEFIGRDACKVPPMQAAVAIYGLRS